MTWLAHIPLFCATVSLLAMVGCPPISIGPPWPPPRPPEPQGSGSISGTLNVVAPELRILSGGPAASVRENAQLSVGQLGIFFADEPDPQAPYPDSFFYYSTLRAAEGLGSLSRSDSGRWTGGYSFTNLPLARYRISFSSYAPKNDGLDVTLSEAQPHITPPVWELDISSGSGRLNGKLLFEGNAPEPTAHLSIAGTTDPDDPPPHPASYSFGTSGHLYGRVFFELEGLSLDRTQISLNPGAAYVTGMYVDGQPASGWVELSEAKPSAEVVMRGQFQRNTYPYPPPSPEAQAASNGAIELSLTVTGGTVWSSDIVAVAELEGGAPAAWNYVFPEQVGLGGKAAISLRTLDPGNYSVRVLRLGATNRDDPQVLAEGEVLLQLPPLSYSEDNRGNRYPYQPEPVATVALSIDVSDL